MTKQGVMVSATVPRRDRLDLLRGAFQSICALERNCVIREASAWLRFVRSGERSQYFLPRAVQMLLSDGLLRDTFVSALRGTKARQGVHLVMV